jgi:regulatory protein
VPGRRRGARTGRGWDAAPARPRARKAPSITVGDPDSWGTGEEPSPVDQSELAREICLRQLAIRPRTRAELAKALKSRGIAEEVAADVLDRYNDVGIIDDAAFARAWVSTRHHGRGLARRALAQELRQHGVDQETAGEALADLDPDTEAATARELAERKLRTMGSAPPDAVFRRLVAMLARKGYPAGVAIGAVKEAIAARDAAGAEFAEFIDVDAMVDAAGPEESAPDAPIG